MLNPRTCDTQVEIIVRVIFTRDRTTACTLYIPRNEYQTQGGICKCVTFQRIFPGGRYRDALKRSFICIQLLSPSFNTNKIFFPSSRRIPPLFPQSKRRQEGGGGTCHETVRDSDGKRGSFRPACFRQQYRACFRTIVDFFRNQLIDHSYSAPVRALTVFSARRDVKSP